MIVLLIGDSHCSGISSTHPEWEHCSIPGITSSRFNRDHNIAFNADCIVISLGGNDLRFPHPPSDTKQELLALRNRITAKKVIWFLTKNFDEVRELQIQIANDHGDLTVDSREFEVSPDDLHLTYQGYMKVADKIISVTANSKEEE
jgi:lysophospholipase L1-like esterase